MIPLQDLDMHNSFELFSMNFSYRGAFLAEREFWKLGTVPSDRNLNFLKIWSKLRFQRESFVIDSQCIQTQGL